MERPPKPFVRTKVDRTGRSTGIPQGKRTRRALGLPKGVGWCVPMPLNLLRSPALIEASPRAVGVLFALMAEHADKGGKENGALVAPYDEIEERGVRRSSIRDAIAELEALGLVQVTQRGGRSYGPRRIPSTYRLTWIGTPDGATATNEWRAIGSVDEAEVRVRNARDRLAAARKRERSARHDRTPG